LTWIFSCYCKKWYLNINDEYKYLAKYVNIFLIKLYLAPNIYIFGVRVMVFNSTFNNISVISWRSVLLVEETGTPRENRRPAASRWMLYRVHLVWAGFQLTTLVVIGTNCIGSCKSNYHPITATTAPLVVIGTNCIGSCKSNYHPITATTAPPRMSFWISLKHALNTGWEFP
jgi:hypothetical protein